MRLSGAFRGIRPLVSGGAFGSSRPRVGPGSRLSHRQAGPLIEASSYDTIPERRALLAWPEGRFAEAVHRLKTPAPKG
jgi:hypothetical protein